MAAGNQGVISYEVEIETANVLVGTKTVVESLSTIDKKMSGTDAAAKNTGKSLDSLSKSINQVGSGGNSIGKVSTDLNGLQKGLSTTEAAAGRAGASIDSFSKKLNRIDVGATTELNNVTGSILESAQASEDAHDPLQKLAESMTEGSESATGFGFSMSALAKIISATIFSGAVLGIAEMVQKYQEMSERVRMATDSQQEFNDVQARLLTTANGTYRSLQEAQELYISTADSLRSMGYSTQQALDITDSMSYAFVKNATTADKAGGAIDAFSKSINTGKVAADQWETITSAIPSVIDDIATSSGKTSAEVRALGAAGKLAGAQLTEGLRAALEANAKAAAAMSSNLVDAAVRSKTAMTAFFVSVENQTGFLQKLTNAIIMAADNLLAFASNSTGVERTITAVSSAAAVLAAVISGRLAGAAATYVKTQTLVLASTIRQIAADQAAAGAALMVARANAAAAESALVAARAAEAAAVGFSHHAAAAAALASAEATATAATISLNSALAASAGVATRAGLAMKGLQSVMTFLGGPVGVILIAAAALYYFSKAATDTKVDVDALNGSLNTLTFNQLSKSALDVQEDVQKLENQLERLQNVSNQKKIFLETDDSFRKKQIENAAAIDTANQELEKRRAALVKIAEAQEKLKIPVESGPSKTPVLPEDAASAKVIQGLKDQESLLKVIGVERAKLAAIQKLGEDASPAQRLEAEALAASIFKLEEAEKQQRDTSKKGLSEAAAARKKATEEEKKGILDNIKVYQDLGVQLASVGQNARDLAMDQAELSLNKYATPEQVQQVRDMAAALYDLNQAKSNKALLGQIDPAAGAQQELEKRLKDIETLKNAEILGKTDAIALKEQAELDYNARMTEIEMQRFAAQSAGNEAMIAGFDALASSGTQALSGLLSGTSSLQDAMGGIANTVLNAVIGSFTQAGVEWVKQQIFMQSATQATKAAEIGGIAAVTAAQTAATGTIAATTTATAATTGATVAASMAPAAGLSSIASFGGAAVIGGAALLATMALAKSSGGRQYGGGVQAGSMYRVNETGAPEIFNAANGRQYMMPNSRGEVVSNKDATAGSGSGGGVVVNIQNYSGAQVSQSQSTVDRQQVIDIVIGDMMQDGKIARATNQITGTRRQGV